MKENREKIIAEMAKVVQWQLYYEMAYATDVATALYEAGYRKIEKKEEEL